MDTGWLSLQMQFNGTIVAVSLCWLEEATPSVLVAQFYKFPLSLVRSANLTNNNACMQPSWRLSLRRPADVWPGSRQCQCREHRVPSAVTWSAPQSRARLAAVSPPPVSDCSAHLRSPAAEHITTTTTPKANEKRTNELAFRWRTFSDYFSLKKSGKRLFFITMTIMQLRVYIINVHRALKHS